jgi:hypothetical protein
MRPQPYRAPRYVCLASSKCTRWRQGPATRADPGSTPSYSPGICIVNSGAEARGGLELPHFPTNIPAKRVTA